MFDKVLTGDTRETITVLSTLEFLKSFYLAGGTGCGKTLILRKQINIKFIPAYQARK